MRILPLTLLSILLAGLQQSWLAWSPDAPDLLLALLAVVWLAGVPQRAVWRAWIVGLLADLADPGSQVFHAISLPLLAIGYTWIERFLQRGPGGRFVVAAMLRLVLGMGDNLVAEGVGIGSGAILASAFWTGCIAVLLGWLIEGIPEGLRPVASRERRPLTRLSLTL
jgi:hypothetical protein